MPVEKYMPGVSHYFDWDEMILTTPVYRFVFMLIFALSLISVDVYILRKYRVNYMFIFDLDPNYKVTHVQLFRVSMMLLTIWMLCFMAQVLICKLEFLF
jgi:phage shock protein PspC (stress-responsive transcriptional regulator)